MTAFNKKFGKRSPEGEEKEYEQKLVDLARVTRVTKGGKRMNFRATIVLGDKAGTVGFGIAKAADVSQAIDKATKSARKKMFTVQLKDETIPNAIYMKFGAAKVMMKPAAKGKGVKAGGAMRVILELAGIPNVTGKILGSNNKINVLYATFEALKKLRRK
jgi:small subunit ribosomal protein S5